MKRFKVFALALALVLAAASARAQGVRVLDYSCTTTNVTLTTTAETVIISSNLTATPRDEAEVVVLAYAQLTTGAGTTAVTPRIRRGTATSGTLVNEANAETIGPAAGSTAPYFAMFTEQRPTSSLQYSLTLSQTGASGNGSALQACMLVIAR
jgi:hypothetical protein